MKQEQVFLKLNQDVSPLEMKRGEYRYALNCRVGITPTGNDLTVENISGTELCSNYEHFNPLFAGAETTGLPASGTNKIVGSIDCEQEGRVAIFIHNSEGKHCLFIYDDEDFKVYKVYEGSKLELGDTHFRHITGSAFIHNDIYWTDSNGEIKHVNLELIKKFNTYTEIPTEAFILVRTPPTQAPWFTKNDATIKLKSEIIKTKVFQFACRYIYRDGSKSVLSFPSELAYQIVVNSTDVFRVYLDAPEITSATSKLIESIEFLVREGYNLSYKVFHTEELSENNTNNSFNVVFDNKGSFRSVDVTETNKPYDYMPVNVKCLEYLEDRVFIGNFTDTWGDVRSIISANIQNVSLEKKEQKDVLIPLGLVSSQGNTNLDYSDNSSTEIRMFKPDSKYGIGVVLYDRFRRKTLVLGYDKLSIDTDQQAYSNPDRNYRKFDIDLAAIKNAVEVVSDYDVEAMAIVRTENLSTNWFVQGRCENVYYVQYINDENLPIFLNEGIAGANTRERYNNVINNQYNYTNAEWLSDNTEMSTSNEIWFDIRNWTLYGIKQPYTFTEGDELSVIQVDLNSTTKCTDKYKIREQRGGFVICDKVLRGDGLVYKNIGITTGEHDTTLFIGDVKDNIFSFDNTKYSNYPPEWQFLYENTIPQIKKLIGIGTGNRVLLTDGRIKDFNDTSTVWTPPTGKKVVDVYMARGGDINFGSGGYDFVVAYEDGWIHATKYDNSYHSITQVSGKPIQVVGNYTIEGQTDGYFIGVTWTGSDGKLNFKVFHENGDSKSYVINGVGVSETSDTLYPNYFKKEERWERDCVLNGVEYEWSYDGTAQFVNTSNGVGGTGKHCLGIAVADVDTPFLIPIWTVYELGFKVQSIHISEAIGESTAGICLTYQIGDSTNSNGDLKKGSIASCIINKKSSGFKIRSFKRTAGYRNMLCGLTQYKNTVQVFPSQIEFLDVFATYSELNDGSIGNANAKEEDPTKGACIIAVTYKSNTLALTDAISPIDNSKKLNFYNRCVFLGYSSTMGTVVARVPPDITVTCNSNDPWGLWSVSRSETYTNWDLGTVSTSGGMTIDIKDYESRLVVGSKAPYLDVSSGYYRVDVTVVSSTGVSYKTKWNLQTGREDTTEGQTPFGLQETWFGGGTDFQVSTVYNYGCKIEISSPRQPQEQNYYYETGNPHYYYGITNSTPVKTIEYGNNDDGDVFLIRKEFRGFYWNGGKDNYVSMNIDPNNTIEWKKPIANPSVELRNSKQITSDFSTAIRFSGQYLSGSRINGINEFNALDEKIMPMEFGSLMKLINTSNTLEDGNVLLCIHTQETASIYVNKVQFADVSGQNVVATADTVLGTFRTLRGSYGTFHPESVSKMNGNVYYYDATKGEFIKYSANGLDPISGRGMRTYFNNFHQKIQNSIGIGDRRNENFYVYIGIDNEFTEIIVTMIDNTENGETLAYNEALNAWSSFYSFLPKGGYSKVNNRLISLNLNPSLVFLHGKDLSRAGLPIKRNAFYGSVTSDSYIEPVFNLSPIDNKIPLTVTIHSDTCWEVEEIKSDWVENGTNSWSECLFEDLEKIDQTWHGAILRDATSPLGIIEGDVMIGKWFKVRLRNTETFNLTGNVSRIYKVFLDMIKSFY